jgi:hypothetical protein
LDQHCAWQTNEAVNKLFGVATVAAHKRELKLAAGGVSLSSQAAAWNLPHTLSGIPAAEPDVASAGGTPLLRIGNTDAAIVNHTGTGWTIYLNTVWDQYPKERAAKFGGAAYRELLHAIFDKAGVRPAVEVTSPDGQPITQAQIARYKFGNAEIVAIVKENVAVAGLVGRDGVTTYNDASLGQVARQELTIKLPRKSYVTDVRTGKQFGFTDVVHSSIVIGDALILALSPEANELKLDGPASARRGDHVSFNLISTTPATTLVRCHVVAPNGTALPLYFRNVLVQQGRGTFTLPFALNDAAGRYLVRATDVVTGATVEKSIELR